MTEYWLCGKCGSECDYQAGRTSCCRHHVGHAYTAQQIKVRRERQWTERIEQMKGKAL